MVLNVNCHSVYRRIESEVYFQFHLSDKRDIILSLQDSLGRCACLFQYVKDDFLVEIILWLFFGEDF